MSPANSPRPVTNGGSSNRVTDWPIHGIFAAALFMPPAQREAMERVGGLMSLLEGHGDVVMDRAGTDVLPQADRFSRVLRERRRQPNPAARMVQRLLGFEAGITLTEGLRETVEWHQDVRDADATAEA